MSWIYIFNNLDDYYLLFKTYLLIEPYFRKTEFLFGKWHNPPKHLIALNDK